MDFYGVEVASENDYKASEGSVQNSFGSSVPKPIGSEAESSRSLFSADDPSEHDDPRTDWLQMKRIPSHTSQNI
jgi:hypothetical protein